MLQFIKAFFIFLNSTNIYMSFSLTKFIGAILVHQVPSIARLFAFLHTSVYSDT